MNSSILKSWGHSAQLVTTKDLWVNILFLLCWARTRGASWKRCVKIEFREILSPDAFHFIPVSHSAILIYRRNSLRGKLHTLPCRLQREMNNTFLNPLLAGGIGGCVYIASLLFILLLAVPSPSISCCYFTSIRGTEKNHEKPFWSTPILKGHCSVKVSILCLVIFPTNISCRKRLSLWIIMSWWR